MQVYNYDLYLEGKLKLPLETNTGIYYDNKRILAGWIEEKLKDPTNSLYKIRKLKYALELARDTGD